MEGNILFQHFSTFYQLQRRSISRHIGNIRLAPVIAAMPLPVDIHLGTEYDEIKEMSMLVAIHIFPSFAHAP
jgi:hypothetical protein